MGPFNAGDCLIEMSAGAGMTPVQMSLRSKIWYTGYKVTILIGQKVIISPYIFHIKCHTNLITSSLDFLCPKKGAIFLILLLKTIF